MIIAVFTPRTPSDRSTTVVIMTLMALSRRGFNESSQHGLITGVRGYPVVWWAARLAGAGLGPARVFLPQGPQRSPGSRPAAGGRAAVRSSLDAGGAAPHNARRTSRSAAAQPPPLSGRGRGEHVAECLCRGFPAEGLAGPGVQLRSDLVQVLAAAGGQAGALREVLAQQPVGVFVAAPLPRRVRVAEIHRHPGGQADLGVLPHLLALVPGQRPAQLGRQRG